MGTRKTILDQDLVKRLDLDSYVQNRYYDSINEVPTLVGESKEDARRREITYLNMKWFMTTLLERMDRMSMYSSLEARVPYADHRLIEFLWNIPWDYKYGGTVKNLLREAFKDLLPYDLLYRKKSPYPKTYNPKYEKILGDKLKDILVDNNSPIIPLIDKTNLLKVINSPKDYGKPWFGQLMAGPQLLAYYIQLDYWMRKYNLSI